MAFHGTDHVHCDTVADDVAGGPIPDRCLAPVLQQLVIDDRVIGEGVRQPVQVEGVHGQDIGGDRSWETRRLRRRDGQSRDLFFENSEAPVELHRSAGADLVLPSRDHERRPALPAGHVDRMNGRVPSQEKTVIPLLYGVPAVLDPSVDKDGIVGKGREERGGIALLRGLEKRCDGVREVGKRHSCSSLISSAARDSPPRRRGIMVRGASAGVLRPAM
jgi:hypothetical protein